MPEAEDLIQLVKEAFRNDDAAAMRGLLDRFPQIGAHINDPVGGYDAPIIIGAKSRAMLDVLLAAGADINAKSRWWAGGFGLLDDADPELAAYAIERGAKITVHAAARLGTLQPRRRQY